MTTQYFSDRSTTGRVSWDSLKIDFSEMNLVSKAKAVFDLKRNLAEFIWNAAALEGNTFTLPEVQTLLDGVTVGGKRHEEAEQIMALSEAMNYMIDLVERDKFQLDKSTSDAIHGLVARHEAIESGFFRGEGLVQGGGAVRLASGGVVEGDPAGEAGIALKTDFENLLAALSGIEDARERALAYFASATRSQFYFDGNKRTARIMMAGELMMNGYEAVNVPYARALEFNESLDVLFRNDDATELIDFLTTCGPKP